MFAFALYLALKGQLADLFPDVNPKELYFYATVAFLAGFSERWAHVLLGNVAGKTGDLDGDEPADDANGQKSRARGAPSR
jgi:hypothetical protein